MTPKKHITIDLKTILFVLTIAGMIFSAGVAWSSLDTQLTNLQQDISEIKATQAAHTDKLEELKMSDADYRGRINLNQQKIDDHIERETP